jgi:hypothetical protein
MRISSISIFLALVVCSSCSFSQLDVVPDTPIEEIQKVELVTAHSDFVLFYSDGKLFMSRNGVTAAIYEKGPLFWALSPSKDRLFLAANKADQFFYTSMQLSEMSKMDLNALKENILKIPSGKPLLEKIHWLNEDLLLLSYKDKTNEIVNKDMDRVSLSGVADRRYPHLSLNGGYLIYLGECSVECHMVVRDMMTGEKEGLIDSEPSFDGLWSPTGRYFAYVPGSYTGDYDLELFDFEADSYGTIVLKPVDHYSFISHNTWVTEQLEGKNRLTGVEIYRWVNDHEFVFLTQSEIGFNIYSYNAETKTLMPIGVPTVGNSSKVSDLIINSELNRIAYILNAGDSLRGESLQELWTSNVDGSGAEMIYKNY